MGVNLANHIADGAGLDPERQQLLRRLKASESMLTRVRQEKNDLQDANTKMDVELKDVRGQLWTPRRRISGFDATFLVSA